MRAAENCLVLCMAFAGLTMEACTGDGVGRINPYFNADALMEGATGILQLDNDCYESASIYEYIGCLPGSPIELLDLSIVDETVLTQIEIPAEWLADADWSAAVHIRALRSGSTEVSMRGTFDDGTTRSATLVVQVVIPDLLTFPLAEAGPPDCPPGRPTLRDLELERIRILVGEELPLTPVAWGRPNVQRIGRVPDRISVGGLLDVSPLVNGNGVSNEIISTATWFGSSRYAYKHGTSIIVRSPGEVEVVPALNNVDTKTLTVEAAAEADLAGIDSLPLNPTPRAPGSLGNFRAIPRNPEGIRFCGGELFKQRLTVRSWTPEVCLVGAVDDEESMQTTNPGSADFKIHF